MKSSTDFISDKRPAILCVAEPKCGKTRLAMAFPRPGILDCDGNLSSAVRVANGKKFLYSQPFVDDAGAEVPEEKRWSRAVAETKLLATSPDVDTIVIDGLSQLTRWGLVHAEAELVKAGINVKKEYLAKYNAFVPLLTGFITMIRIPKKYVVVNVHPTLDKDELSGRIRYKLDIPGRLSDNLGGQFTDVIAMDCVADPGSKIGAKYTICTKPTGYHPNLGTSMDLEPRIDITGKNPDEIWSIIGPKLSTGTPPVK
jgi:hypothetical protein